MSKVTIFVEGINDEVFLRKFIRFRYGIELKEKDIGGIIDMKGHGKQHFFENKFKESIDFGYTNLLFEDADIPEKNNRGFENVNTSLIESATRYNFEHFIWPNNQTNGSLEDLWSNIIASPKKEWTDCYQKYMQCLANNNCKIPDEHGQWKHISGHFLNDKNFDFKNEHWHITEENEAIKPLLLFLDKYFSKTS